jgi:hypothetical protein
MRGHGLLFRASYDDAYMLAHPHLKVNLTTLVNFSQLLPYIFSALTVAVLKPAFL